MADTLPEAANANGIYARTLDWKPECHPYWGYTRRNTSAVQGVVALTGRVLVGQQGYRAERATIRELWVVGGVPVPRIFLTNLLEDRYKCDVHYEPPKSQFPEWEHA